MVYYFTSNSINPPATIYMGKDKEENEDLIKYGLDDDIWYVPLELPTSRTYDCYQGTSATAAM